MVLFLTRDCYMHTPMYVYFRHLIWFYCSYFNIDTVVNITQNNYEHKTLLKTEVT